MTTARPVTCARLTRRYRFSASHRLHSPVLSEEENRNVYGKCNNPYGHGHDYILDVTVAGTPDAATGLIVSRNELDQWVERKVLKLFNHRYINKDVAAFATQVPTTENVALVIATLLTEDWSVAFPSTAARVARVHILETDRNGFEVRLDSAGHVVREQCQT